MKILCMHQKIEDERHIEILLQNKIEHTTHPDFDAKKNCIYWHRIYDNVVTSFIRHIELYKSKHLVLINKKYLTDRSI